MILNLKEEFLRAAVLQLLLSNLVYVITELKCGVELSELNRQKWKKIKLFESFIDFEVFEQIL